MESTADRTREMPVWVPDTATAIEARNLSAAYDRHLVLRDVRFELPAGEIIAVIGPNGAGKSTLFKVLTGIKKPLTGEVSILGDSIDTARQNNRIAYIPQETDIDWDFPISVRDVVLGGRFGRIRREGGVKRFLPAFLTGRVHHDSVSRALEAVNMTELGQRPIGALSGGQKKRVFLARAIAQDADLLLLDEPLAGVDRATETLFFALLERFRDDGKTIVMITHDIPTVEAYADRVLLLSKTIILCGTPSETLTDDNLERTYHGTVLRTAREQGS